MVLIIGGASSGRTAFAKENFPDRTLINGVDEMVRTAMERKEMKQLAKQLLSQKKAVIVLDELGCGIAPLEASERLFRDAYGRLGISLAREAESVYRVVCGIGRRIR